MADHTERAFVPESREPSRRRFMIAGEHVILRAFEREDAERCYRWMNDPNIVRTLKSRYPIAFQNEMEWLDRAMHASATERHFAIERKDDRTHIGNASIHGIDWVSRTAWFGLFIGEPSAWNRGFGSDAIGTLVRFAFDEMNLVKLRINVFDYNDRAKHILEGRGFVTEGRLRRDFYREGTWHDLVILSIFRDGAAPTETAQS
jgi:RimJ/RimL family protein N-acetyltransferase